MPQSFPTLPNAVTSPAPNAGFVALSDNGTVIPPDTIGAVGPRHLMTTLNSQIRIQDKSGTVLVTLSLNQFWSVLGNPDAYDPRIHYDSLAGRWIFVASGNPASGNALFLFGASKTDDPTGQWTVYKLDVDSTNQLWNDYPNVGFNKDWLVVSFNMFTLGGSFDSARLYVVTKADLYAGVANLSLRAFRDGAAFSLAPAVTYDVSLGNLYIVQSLNGNFQGDGYIDVSVIRGAVGSEEWGYVGSVASATPWKEFTNADFAPQSGSTRKINNGDDRMQNVVYRNGSLWAAHTVFLPASNPTHSAVQWWQFTPSLIVQQHGFIEDRSAKFFYAYPSIAVNQNSDVLIGYSRFSAGTFASAAYSFRKSSDAANGLQTPLVFKAGEAAYFKDFGVGENRWGDYSGTVVDPSDDVTMWTIQEYAGSPSGGSSMWSTWWAKVVPAGGGMPKITSFSPVDGSAGAFVTITGSNLAEVTKVQFHGVSAAIVSATAAEIVAVVPAAATTGPIDVTTPLGTATSAADFTVTPGATRIISLSGNLALGEVTIGSTAKAVLTINNNGDSPLTVTGITYPGGFTGPWSGTIPAGAAQSVTVVFAPVAAQLYGGDLTVTSDASSGESTWPVSGNGIAAARFSLSLSAKPAVGGRIFVGPVPDGDGKYPAGTVVTLTARTNSTYSFGAWSGDASGSTNPVQVTMDGDRSVAASFLPLNVPDISSPRGVDATAGVSFSYWIAATNPSIVSYGAAGLPSGLEIDAASGLISGVPSDVGIFLVRITATNAAGEGSAMLTISVGSAVNFAAQKGGYSGLVEANVPEHATSGAVALSLNRNGSFSAVLWYAGSRYPVVGRFSANGVYRKTVSRRNLSPLNLTLLVETSGLDARIGGAAEAGGVVSRLAAYRAAFNARSRPAPQAGNYTVISTPRPEDEADPGLPQGHGCGTMKVSKAGVVRTVKTLGDGTRISHSAALSDQNQWPVYVALYKGKGSLIGTMRFVDGDASRDAGASMNWFKLPLPGSALFPAGFAMEPVFQVARYVPPAKGTRVLDLTDAPNNARLVLDQGNLPAQRGVLVTLDRNNQVIVAPTERLTVKITSATGKFTGSFFDPNGKKRSFLGYVYQKANIGAGMFKGTGAYGWVQLESATALLPAAPLAGVAPAREDNATAAESP